MALQKTITLPNGATGNYIRLTLYLWDRVAKEASAHFMLHTSAALAVAAPDAPLCLVAKLRLTGAKFDQYLSTAVLEALSGAGPDPVRDQLYAAAKAEPLLAGGGLTELTLADAVSV